MQLTFYTKPRNFRIPETSILSVYLTIDNWNDFSYRTFYGITLFDENGNRHDLGYIKIANFGQTTDDRIELDEQFNRLDDRYFSLGQSPEYYVTIQGLDPAELDYVNWQVASPTSSMIDNIQLVAKNNNNLQVLEVNADSKIKLYPNPSKNYINIKGGKENAEKVIVDSSGKVIIKTLDKKINISHLPAGKYFINIIPETCCNSMDLCSNANWYASLYSGNAFS